MPPRHYVVLATALVAVCSNVSAIVITNIGTAYTQDFNTLASSGTTADLLPARWLFSEAGTNANATYGVGTGSSATGNTYSFGSIGSTDRALGAIRTGTLAPMFGVELTNGTGRLLNALEVSFVGEQWRLGTSGRTDRLDFQLSADATSLVTGTWSDFDSLDFVAPISTGSVGLLDGNAAANRSALAASILGLAWADGASLWLRWSDFDASGADDGLAVDDFSLTARGPATAPSQSVPDSLPMAAALVIVLAGLAAVRRGMPVLASVA